MCTFTEEHYYNYSHEISLETILSHGRGEDPTMADNQCTLDQF